jgi:hypothetical protein
VEDVVGTRGRLDYSGIAGSLTSLSIRETSFIVILLYDPDGTVIEVNSGCDSMVN